MAVSKDLLLAILSMDSYNRGYEPGILLDGNQIGSATVGGDELLPGGSQAADFYAVAYSDATWGTIISYRGTDNPQIIPSLPWTDESENPQGGSDVWNGYGTGVGSSLNGQAHT